MAENNEDDAKETLLRQLTDDQKTLLFQALKLVKQRVFSDVVRRVRNYLIVAVSLVTVFGALSVVGLKTAIKDATVGALREDASLRQAIKDDASAKVTEAQELLDKLKALLEDAKTEKLSTANSTLQDLESILENARREKQEDNLLFEKSAEELNVLINELRKLRDREASQQ